jgi:uncharacterized protein YdeI (YjbR/CyaY-like superfamily)
MGARDPRIDAYIESSADFARPILTHLREVVHSACPRVEETMKWSAPHFMYEGMMCGMAAFKAHCAFGFWKGSLILPNDPKASEAMGQFGCIRSLSDLPSKKVLAGYIKEAMRLNEEGVKAPARTKSRDAAAREVVVPEALAAALKKNRKAREAFERFSPSHRREYAEWIAEAKGEDTRARRVATTVEWLTEGKSRNWKYVKSRDG